MDYGHILDALRLIPDMPEFLILEFENNFRSNLSSIDLKVLASGNIPKITIHNCLISSLQHISSIARTEYERSQDIKFLKLDVTLWNPLTASMFQQLVNITVKAMPSQQSLEDHKMQKNKKHSKPVPLPVNPTEDEQSDIRKRLKAVIITKPTLYSTPYHGHVKCTVPKCEACHSLFMSLNITRCDGHKKCCSVGWYPHVGPSLWKMLKKRHSTGKPMNIAVKVCKSHEIPSLAGNQTKQSSGCIDDDQISICSERSDNTMVTDSVSTQSAASEPPSPKRAWCDDVEAMYLSKRVSRDTSFAFEG